MEYERLTNKIISHLLFRGIKHKVLAPVISGGYSILSSRLLPERLDQEHDIVLKCIAMGICNAYTILLAFPYHPHDERGMTIELSRPCRVQPDFPVSGGRNGYISTNPRM